MADLRRRKEVEVEVEGLNWGWEEGRGGAVDVEAREERRERSDLPRRGTRHGWGRKARMEELGT